MTRFTDGPAAGVALTLRRAPLYIRAARDQHGKWDALDQLDDEPKKGEELFAYRRVGKAGTMHLDYTDRVTRRRCPSPGSRPSFRGAVAEAEQQPEGKPDAKE